MSYYHIMKHQLSWKDVLPSSKKYKQKPASPEGKPSLRKLTGIEKRRRVTRQVLSDILTRCEVHPKFFSIEISEDEVGELMCKYGIGYAALRIATRKIGFQCSRPKSTRVATWTAPANARELLDRYYPEGIPNV